MALEQTDPSFVSRIEGFSVLFRRCLQMRPDDTALVIYDEAFLPYLDALVQFIISDRLHASFVSIPKAYQRALIEWTAGEDPEIDLPRGVTAACRVSSIIVNCLDADLDTARLRGAILHNFRPNDCRFAHIPGISDSILRILTKTPIDQVVQSAETVAWALGEAAVGELITTGPGGQQCRLSMQLDMWDNEPMISTGVIHPNSWGNVPPGEVFCCPEDLYVNGSVCIDGSIPGSLLNNGEATVIEFEQGRLVRWIPEGTTTVVGKFLTEQRALAAKREDFNWNAFAELGIGLNPVVQSLTGDGLLDEKALGTIHVAIGNNKSFGHRIKSFIHADMVIRHPTLLLDGLVLVDKGHVRVADVEKLRAVVAAEPISWHRDLRIHFKLANLEFQEGMALRRLVSAGRIGYVAMTELSTDQWLAGLISEVSEDQPLTYSQLRDWTSSDRLDGALDVLNHYRVIKLEVPHEQNERSNHSVCASRSRLQGH